MTAEREEASRILNLWKAGAEEDEGVTPALVDWALRIGGDSVGVKHFTPDGEQVFYLERFV